MDTDLESVLGQTDGVKSRRKETDVQHNEDDDDNSSQQSFSSQGSSLPFDGNEDNDDDFSSKGSNPDNAFGDADDAFVNSLENGSGSTGFTNDGLWAEAHHRSAAKNTNPSPQRPRVSLRSFTANGFFNNKTKTTSTGIFDSSSIGTKMPPKPPPTAPPIDSRKKSLRGATEGDLFGTQKAKVRDLSAATSTGFDRNRFKNLSTSTALSGDVDYALGTSVTGVSTWMVSKDMLTQESLDQLDSDNEDSLHDDSDEYDDDEPTMFECVFPNTDANPSIMIPLSVAQKIPMLNALWAKANNSSSSNKNVISVDMDGVGITREEVFNAIYVEETPNNPHPTSLVSPPGMMSIAEEGTSSVSVTSGGHSSQQVAYVITSDPKEPDSLSRAWI